MPKFVYDKEYNSLKNKEAAFDSIISAVLANNSGLKEEDITAELIIEALTADHSVTDPELQTKFDTLQANYDKLVNEHDELKQQVTNLINGAAEPPAPISAGSEPTAKPLSLADFANKNAGDTAAILGQCEKEGII